jgi:hypothetical protein
VIATGILLGGFVGGYVASVKTRMNHLATGLAVGAAIAIIGTVFTLPLVGSLGPAVLGEVAAYLLAVATAFCGAKLGLTRRMKWDRECDALDPWKSPSPDRPQAGPGSSV